MDRQSALSRDSRIRTGPLTSTATDAEPSSCRNQRRQFEARSVKGNLRPSFTPALPPAELSEPVDSRPTLQ
ncbi:uncharacterized protein PAN0_031c6235 [Moesziomyces antarcticus]|uniref:Uncharacterized protein n=1 Tax=Pseudozyma antarctica TaxID=84753 RepID=A0A081CMV9_PSEA2|nr:uncharacterized protein PAN0_031c6235 [Moesziomyces antarcticus]GAK68005.1 hypothetical protein PAN0_031c6235 [Moesziomyces antarcticus]